MTRARRSVNIPQQSARPRFHQTTWQRKRTPKRLRKRKNEAARLAPGHLIIEPIESVESLLALEDELLAELMAAVKRAAQEIVRVHGAYRVHTDLGGHNNRLRWHVYAPPS